MARIALGVRLLSRYNWPTGRPDAAPRLTLHNLSEGLERVMCDEGESTRPSCLDPKRWLVAVVLPRTVPLVVVDHGEPSSCSLDSERVLTSASNTVRPAKGGGSRTTD